MSNIKTLVNNIKINILLDDNFWKQYLNLNESQILTYVESKTEEELGMIIDEFVIGMVSGLHFDTFRYDTLNKFLVTNFLDNLFEARKTLIDYDIFDFDDNERFHMINNYVDSQYWDDALTFKNLLICDFIKSSNYFLTESPTVFLKQDGIRFSDDKLNQAYSTFHEILMDQEELLPIVNNGDYYFNFMMQAFELNDIDFSEEIVTAFFNRLAKELDWLRSYNDKSIYGVDWDDFNKNEDIYTDSKKHLNDYFTNKFGVDLLSAKHFLNILF